MSTKNWRTWLGASVLSLASVVPAQAALTVNFNGVAPTQFSGTSISTEGFTFTSSGMGFSGVDTPLSFSDFGNAPPNANSNFLYMLNNDGILIERDDGLAFALKSFDIAFLSPVAGSGIPGASPGLLGAIGFDTDGLLVAVDFFDLPTADANGNFRFKRQYGLGSLDNMRLGSIFFASCAYQDDGSCPFDGSGLIPAQFAIDNLSVPEPNAALLALTALGLLAAARRRRTV